MAGLVNDPGSMQPALGASWQATSAFHAATGTQGEERAFSCRESWQMSFRLTS